MVWAAIEIDGDLDTGEYTSDMLSPVALPYLRGLPQAIFQDLILFVVFLPSSNQRVFNI